MDKELESAVKVLLKQITTPPRNVSGIRKFLEGLLGTLNSPFVVTLVGGILLATVSAYITARTAENQKLLETHLAELHQKQSLIDSFPTKVEQYLALTRSVRNREIFLQLWQTEPTRDIWKSNSSWVI